MRFWIDLSGQEFAEGQAKWVHALPVNKTYQHPLYGRIEFTADRIARFASNVKSRVRGTDLDIDYDHKIKSGEAAGWVKDAEARSDGLWLLVEWTKDAAQKLSQKAYRYFSPEFVDRWKHPETGVEHSDVVLGGALTNRPFLKDLVPINFSEVIDEGNVMDEATRKLWAKVLGLDPEKATESEVNEALKNYKTPEPTALDLSKAKVEKQDDGTYKVTAEGASGEVIIKPDTVVVPASETDEQIKKLAETNPAVARMLAQQEEQSKRLKDLEAANKLSEVNSGLSMLESDTRKLPPAAAKKFREALVVAPKTLSDSFYEGLRILFTEGFVETGQRSGGNTDPTKFTESDDVQKFIDAVDEAVAASEGKINYRDAVEKVRTTKPSLYEAYERATTDAVVIE